MGVCFDGRGTEDGAHAVRPYMGRCGMRFNELQLRFGGEWSEEPEDSGAISEMEARQISEAARQALERTVDEGREYSGAREYSGGRKTEGGLGMAGWYGEYERLIRLGWPWRVAVYMAWASSPKLGRWPGGVEELATQVLGLRSARVIYTWRQKYPAIEQTVAVLQSAPLWEHRREVFEALVSVASMPDYKGFNDRKLFLEMTGDYVPRSVQQTLVGQSSRDLSELSDAELDALMGTPPSVPPQNEYILEREGELLTDGEGHSPNVNELTDGEGDLPNVNKLTDGEG